MHDGGECADDTGIPGRSGQGPAPDQRSGLDSAAQGPAFAKKQLIAQNLKLTDAEATKFWPVYDQYVAELAKINDKKYATIQEYADKFGTLSDDQAMSLIKNWLDVDVAATQLRAKYLPIVAKAVGGKKAATFAQLDRRIASMVDLQLGSQIPLVQTQ